MAALSLSVQEAVNSGLPLCRPDLEREEGDGASVAEEGAHSPATEQVPEPDIQPVGFLNQHRYLSNWKRGTPYFLKDSGIIFLFVNVVLKLRVWIPWYEFRSFMHTGMFYVPEEYYDERKSEKDIGDYSLLK